jgi:hypothetical protein
MDLESAYGDIDVVTHLALLLFTQALKALPRDAYP